MSEYKLTYFDARGLAEPIRLIFKYANVPFEDNRFTPEEWPKIKLTTPTGKVPLFELNDGNYLVESNAISRYLARKYGLAGKNDFEEAKVDSIADQHKDFFSQTIPWLLVKFGREKGDEITLIKLQLFMASLIMDGPKLNSLIETIYFTTSQPVTVELLQSMYQIMGHQHTLKERCEEFGCRSLIVLIRKYSERFKPFLDMHTCSDGKLYFVNKHIQMPEFILADAKNKIMQTPNARVFFEDTIYFEKQNQEEYLAGRAEFAKLVHECEKAGIVDRDCLVPLSRIHKRMEERFPGRKPTEVIKEWFQTKHLEAIMEEILFDDIDCFLSGNRKECRFRMKPGMTLEEVLTNIENIRNGHKEFKMKRDAVLYLHNRPSFPQREQYQKRNIQHYPKVIQRPIYVPLPNDDILLDSDADDYRTEDVPDDGIKCHIQDVGWKRSQNNNNEGTKPSAPLSHRDRVSKFSNIQLTYGLIEDENLDEIIKNSL